MSDVEWVKYALRRMEWILGEAWKVVRVVWMPLDARGQGRKRVEKERRRVEEAAGKLEWWGRETERRKKLCLEAVKGEEGRRGHMEGLKEMVRRGKWCNSMDEKRKETSAEEKEGFRPEEKYLNKDKCMKVEVMEV